MLFPPTQPLNTSNLTNPFKIENGPARYTYYPPSAYHARLAYMNIIPPNYEKIVQRTSDALVDLARAYDLDLGIGAEWTTWAILKFEQAIQMVQLNMPTAGFGLGIDWQEIRPE